MPHSVSSASPSDDGSGDSLPGLLAGISLGDSPETEAVEREPSRPNPSETHRSPVLEVGPVEQNSPVFSPSAAHISNGSEAYHAEYSVDELTRNVIPQQVARLQKPQRFILNETDDLYIQGKEFQTKWGIPDNGFLNWIALLSGWVEFPAILLLNPSPWDHLSFDDMLRKSPTLSWLQKILQSMGLQLADVIILDTFPMLRDNLRDDILEQMGPARRDELARESFALTRATLELIQPRVMISCQCCTKPNNERWEFFNADNLAQQLCSSVLRARERRVRELDVNGHRMQVVQGMHPQYLVKRDTTQEEVLVELFTQVFRSFGAWQSRRLTMEKELRDAGATLLSLVALLQQQIQRYGKLCKQAGSEMDGPVTAKHVEELRTQLHGWECRRSDGAA
ncbi:hypothetical protein BDV38DRAFT_260380 [Aspergillus pseudotamarii]|uniref:Uncharacterized protein n=1 Tax=Aspergillus pseudotamarii TaxID=132259 RepID=A0A5N6SDP8_ASPPS|nr:uncharacterized protein BDV38DRAFT_260380 [Aspergillus pseudotamarii]KAE8132745.1 hypothetical protein BDV38DRAFT_260380 [Aspergillus pseudotamarii]